jgi:hypothetical protein
MLGGHRQFSYAPRFDGAMIGAGAVVKDAEVPVVVDVLWLATAVGCDGRRRGGRPAE